MLQSKRKQWSGWVGLFFSSTFFTGFLPGWLHPKLKGKGGGLMGSIVAGLFLWPLWDAAWCGPAYITIAAGIFSSHLGLWAVREGETLMFSKWGQRRRHTGELVSYDYNETNIDEVAGMFWAASVVWHFRGEFGVGTLFWIFVMFRILDTFKPWPISYVEKYWKTTNPAFSVIIDDVFAGLIAGLAVLLAMAWVATAHHSIML